jgi:hypothetical protein
LFWTPSVVSVALICAEVMRTGDAAAAVAAGDAAALATVAAGEAAAATTVATGEAAAAPAVAMGEAAAVAADPTVGAVGAAEGEQAVSNSAIAKHPEPADIVLNRPELMLPNGANHDIS